MTASFNILHSYGRTSRLGIDYDIYYENTGLRITVSKCCKKVERVLPYPVTDKDLMNIPFELINELKEKGEK